MSTRLVAVCFDSGASPQVHFSEFPSVVGPEKVPCGWGFGWYPEGERAASVVEDPQLSGRRGHGACSRTGPTFAPPSFSLLRWAPPISALGRILTLFNFVVRD